MSFNDIHDHLLFMTYFNFLAEAFIAKPQGSSFEHCTLTDLGNNPAVEIVNV